MPQITLEISAEFLDELQPYRSQLLELLRIGLAEWHKSKAAANTERAIKALLKQMADEGILIQPQPYPANYHPPDRPLVQVTGKPLSEIIIEQRNRSW